MMPMLSAWMCILKTWLMGFVYHCITNHWHLALSMPCFRCRMPMLRLHRHDVAGHCCVCGLWALWSSILLISLFFLLRPSQHSNKQQPISPPSAADSSPENDENSGCFGFCSYCFTDDVISITLDDCIALRSSFSSQQRSLYDSIGARPLIATRSIKNS